MLPLILGRRVSALTALVVITSIESESPQLHRWSVSLGCLPVNGLLLSLEALKKVQVIESKGIQIQEKGIGRGLEAVMENPHDCLYMCFPFAYHTVSVPR